MSVGGNVTPTSASVPQAARAKKLELQSRVEGLQKDLAEVSKLTPGQLRSENGQIAELNEVGRYIPHYTCAQRMAKFQS